ncbi:hypothetical protein ACJIZ3_016383 [Penstemon smallii]|uniref:Zinc-ribbon domain-containing protein n=1 Tax=Penstemon smallii TaxID=265156 RepID=A0ABD3RUV2_9LAMI
MSEKSEVRLVRCPKCEKLLPEVTGYSVYQCGGCGAVLRAKNKDVDLDTFSEKSNEEMVGNTIEKLSDRYAKMSVTEERTMDLGDNSESDVRSNISSSSRTERRRILRDRAQNFRPNLMNKEENWEVEADEIQDKRSNKMAHDFEDLTIYNENLPRQGRLVNGRNGEKKDMEGPLNPPYRSNYDYELQTRNKNDIDGFNNVRDDREELLRKLDELQGQLSRSGNLTGKGKEKAPLDRRMAYQDPYALENRYPDSSLGMNRPYHDTQFKRPNYRNQYSEPPPLMRREEIGGNEFYPPPYGPSHVHGYEDPSRSHMLGRGPHQTPAPYPETRSHAYMMEPYVNDNMKPYPRHRPSCSCYECSNKRQVPSYGDNYYDGSNDTRFNYHENHSSFGSRDYNLRTSNSSSLRSHNPHLHTRWPSDLNSEVDGFTRRRLQRVHLPSGGKNCRPFAGGTPFLSCYNCFELLLLPKKVLIRNNSRRKVRCGACTTVIAFAVSDKNLVVLVDEEAKVDDMPSTFGDENMVKERTTFSSEDYDNSGYDFQSMEARKDSNLADVATNGKEFRPPAGSPLQNHLEFSDKFHAANRFEEGNISGRSENNKELPNKSNTRQRKESSATEIDLSSNEYCNTGTTFDSGEASREGDHMKGNKAKTFFAGFKDSNGSNRVDEQEKANLTVNGHLIPDRLIKKAEKMAGTIHPGNYWYDFRAGFWGAVGGPCLGIVPPFIEEFNYPMPEHCGGGNTHVYVNGRELNLKDLNLLGSRGLPTDRDRSYIIEISGRVLDEDTGEELDSLGKLAPTVEKAKRGFGMRDPNADAR